MKDIATWFGANFPKEAKGFVEKLVKSYKEELLRHMDWFQDDIPMINYGERCQVGFMAMGLSRMFSEKYAVLQEYKTSSSTEFVDLGVMEMLPDGVKQYWIVEAKYISYEKDSYSVLEYDEDFFEMIFTLGKEQLSSYAFADKEFCEKHSAIGISIVLHPFFHDQVEKPLLSDYSNPEIWDSINLINFRRNVEQIKNSSNLYYSLYEVLHTNENGINQIVGFEIFGRVVSHQEFS